MSLVRTPKPHARCFRAFAAAISLSGLGCVGPGSDVANPDTASYVGPNADFGTDLWAGGELEHFRSDYWIRVSDTEASPRGLLVPDPFRVMYGNGEKIRITATRSGVELKDVTVQPGESPRLIAGWSGGFILASDDMILDADAALLPTVATPVAGGTITAAESAAGQVAITLSDRGKCSLVVLSAPVDGVRAERLRQGVEATRCDSRDALAISDDARHVWLGGPTNIRHVDLTGDAPVDATWGPAGRADQVRWDAASGHLLVAHTEIGTLRAIGMDEQVAWETAFGFEIRTIAPATDSAPGFGTFDTGAPDAPSPTVLVSVGSEWDPSGVVRVDPRDGRSYYEIWTDLVPNQVAVSPDGGTLALHTRDRIDVFLRRR